MRRWNLKAAFLAAAILGGLVALVVVLWSRPQVLLYVLLGFVALLAYGALYLIVAARLEKKREAARPAGGGADSREEPPTEELPRIPPGDNVTPISSAKAPAKQKTDAP